MQKSDQHIDDESLLAQFVSEGDAAILGQLYGRYMPMVYGLSLKYLGSVEDAEDAVMEIFEELAAKLADHRVRNFRTWLWSVARNHCLGRLRKAKRAPRADFDEQVVESAAFLHLLSEPASEEEALGTLEGCMSRLPERQREAVALFFVERKSYVEIAEAMMWPLSNVKSYIQNGKRNLRICLEKHGVSGIY